MDVERSAIGRLRPHKRASFGARRNPKVDGLVHALPEHLNTVAGVLESRRARQVEHLGAPVQLVRPKGKNRLSLGEMEFLWYLVSDYQKVLPTR